MNAIFSFRYMRQDTHRIIICQGNRKEDDRCEYYNPTFPHTQQLFPDWHWWTNVLIRHIRIRSHFTLQWIHRNSTNYLTLWLQVGCVIFCNNNALRVPFMIVCDNKNVIDVQESQLLFVLFIINRTFNCFSRRQMIIMYFFPSGIKF